MPKIDEPQIKPSIELDDNTLEIYTDDNAQQQTPEKIEEPIVNEQLPEEQQDTQTKRGRGRPRKNQVIEEENKPKRGRGRPRKQLEGQMLQEKQEEEQEEKEVDLFNLDDETEEQKTDVELFNLDDKTEEQDTDMDLFNLDDETEEQETDADLFNLDDETEEQDTDVDLFSMDDDSDIDLFNISENEESNDSKQTEITNKTSEQHQMGTNNNITQDNFENINSSISKTTYASSDFNTLLTVDKKIVVFVGTTKNGTSFITNNTAELLASIGIQTAILDMTKTKNAYYIYTNNEESLRETAKNCMKDLQNGITEGLKVKKNLTVYTEMPGEENEYEIEKVLSTLLTQYSAILIDADFDTNPEIFARAQEIYLVQTMDVLTIQPLTAFLRNLKSKGILEPEKLKIVINKAQRIRSLSTKTLIGGMSCYNSPNMTYMTELFNKDNIKYCEIPFEIQNYVKYLDSLVNCSISLNGYTKQFMIALKTLANMVYPLVNKQPYSAFYGAKEKREPFSKQVNDTLNEMKRKY